MEPHGQSPWYLTQRPCGATFRSHDGVFLPVSIGRSPDAGTKMEVAAQKKPFLQSGSTFIAFD